MPMGMYGGKLGGGGDGGGLVGGGGKGGGGDGTGDGGGGHGGDGGAAVIKMRVTVDDVKTVYRHTSGDTGNRSDAIYYQPGYGGSVKNPEFCLREGANIEILEIDRVK